MGSLLPCTFPSLRFSQGLQAPGAVCDFFLIDICRQIVYGFLERSAPGIITLAGRVEDPGDSVHRGNMRLLGFLIQREKGAIVGSYGPAIIDLQERVDIIERHQKLKVKEAELEEVKQSEIDKVLTAGPSAVGAGSLWEGI